MRKSFGSHGVTLDIVSCFHQIPISSEIQPYFCFKHADAFYSIVTVPTGGKHPPTLAQLITKWIAGSPLSIVTDVHIDNIRFLGAPRCIEHALEGALHRAAEIECEIRTEAFGTEYIFLGVFFSTTDHTAQLSQKWIDKFETCTLSPNATLREVLGMFGKLMYASSVLAISKAEFYLFFKFLRRRTGWDLDEDACLWQCLLPCIDAWCVKILKNKPRFINSADLPRTVLFTDASLVGWGAICVRSDGSICSIGRRWEDEDANHSINILEAKALANAMDVLQMDHHLDVFVDNTSLLANVRRTRSGNFLFNNIVGHICSDRILNIQYIKSNENPADVFSREFPTTS